MSWLWFLAIMLIILGALCYIEQLFGFKWSRKTLVLLLASYHDLAGYGLGRRAKRIGGNGWACSERLAFRLLEP
jgi:hypothetical protein